jgi:hypothetical protein
MADQPETQLLIRHDEELNTFSSQHSLKILQFFPIQVTAQSTIDFVGIFNRPFAEEWLDAERRNHQRQDEVLPG